MANVDYKISKGLHKAAKAIVYFAIPFAITQFVAAFPEMANMTAGEIVTLLMPEQFKTLTLGGALVLLANYMKMKLPAGSKLGKII